MNIQKECVVFIETGNLFKITIETLEKKITGSKLRSDIQDFQLNLRIWKE